VAPAVPTSRPASHASRFVTSRRGHGPGIVEDLLPGDFLAIAATFLNQLETIGVDRQRIGLLVDDDLALQGSFKLCCHGWGLIQRVRWPGGVSHPLPGQYALAGGEESP